MVQVIKTSIEEGGWVDQNRLVSSHLGGRRPQHKFFLVVSGAAGLSGINNIAAQFIAITFPNNPIMDVILRLYMIALFVVVVMNELEFTSFIRESKILTDWVTRGIFYTFLGILGVVEYDVGADNHYRYRNQSYNNKNGYYNPMMPTKEDFVEWYLFLVSWIMFGVGVVYIVLGAMCMQRKFNALKNEYNNQQQGGGAFQPKPLEQPPEARLVLAR